MNILNVGDIVLIKDYDANDYREFIKNIKVENSKCHFESNRLYSAKTDNFQILIQNDEIVRICNLDPEIDNDYVLTNIWKVPSFYNGENDYINVYHNEKQIIANVKEVNHNVCD